MGKKRIPRGVRNNNPLNIRYVEKNNWYGRRTEKTDAEFEEFVSIDFGYRAAFMLIHKYMTCRHACNVFEIVSRWAPATDSNDPWSYSKIVCQRSGVGLYERLEFRDWERVTRVVHAMAFVENGIDMSYVEALKGYVLACISYHFYDLVNEVQEQIKVIEAREG